MKYMYTVAITYVGFYGCLVNSVDLQWCCGSVEFAGNLHTKEQWTCSRRELLSLVLGSDRRDNQNMTTLHKKAFLLLSLLNFIPVIQSDAVKNNTECFYIVVVVCFINYPEWDHLIDDLKRILEALQTLGVSFCDYERVDYRAHPVRTTVSFYVSVVTLDWLQEVLLSEHNRPLI